MRFSTRLLVLASLSLVACNLSDPNPPLSQSGTTDAGGSTDAGSGADTGSGEDAGQDAGADLGGDDAGGVLDLTITLTRPDASPVYTNGSVEFGFTLDGEPDSVDLVATVDGDETIIGSELAAPYDFTWDTTQYDEARYTVFARATRAGASVDSNPITVVVDRTPPTIRSQYPANGSNVAVISRGISFQFNEFIDPATVSTDSFSVGQNGRPASFAAALNDVGDGFTITLDEAPAAGDQIDVSIVADRVSDRAGNTIGDTLTTWVYPSYGQLTTLDLVSTNGATVSLDRNDSTRTIALAVNDCISIQSRTCANHDLKVALLGEELTRLGDVAEAEVDTAIFSHDVAIADDGSVYVAYSYDASDSITSASGSIRLRKWDGTMWTDVGGDLDYKPQQDARYPKLLIDDGKVYVSWFEFNGTTSPSTGIPIADVFVGIVDEGGVDFLGADSINRNPSVSTAELINYRGLELAAFGGGIQLGFADTHGSYVFQLTNSQWSQFSAGADLDGAYLVDLVESVAGAGVVAYFVNGQQTRLIDVRADGTRPTQRWFIPGTRVLDTAYMDTIGAYFMPSLLPNTGANLVFEGDPPAAIFNSAPFTGPFADARVVLDFESRPVIVSIDASATPKLRAVTPNR